jgi:hypothetical protein
MSVVLFDTRPRGRGSQAGHGHRTASPAVIQASLSETAVLDKSLASVTCPVVRSRTGSAFAADDPAASRGGAKEGGCPPRPL